MCVLLFLSLLTLINGTFSVPYEEIKVEVKGVAIIDGQSDLTFLTT